MIYKAEEVIWIFDTEGGWDGESKVLLEVLADLTIQLLRLTSVLFYSFFWGHLTSCMYK